MLNPVDIKHPLAHSFERRKLWTREEPPRIAEIFPDQRYELIEGELIDKLGQNPRHAAVIMLLIRILSEAFPAG